jgi:hypothetical protein
VCPPPSTAPTAQPISLNEVWGRLAAPQRQQLCQALSLLVAKRLLPVDRKEVPHEAS